MDWSAYEFGLKKVLTLDVIMYYFCVPMIIKELFFLFSIVSFEGSHYFFFFFFFCKMNRNC